MDISPAVEDDTNLLHLLAAIHIDDDRAPSTPPVPQLATRNSTPRRSAPSRARCRRLPPRPRSSPSFSPSNSVAPPPSPTAPSPAAPSPAAPSPAALDPVNLSRPGAPPSFRFLPLPAHPVIFRAPSAARTSRCLAFHRKQPFAALLTSATTPSSSPSTPASFQSDTTSLSTFTSHAIKVVSSLLENHPDSKYLHSRFAAHIAQLRLEWNARLISKSYFLTSVVNFVRNNFENAQHIDLVNSFKSAQREQYKQSLSRLNVSLAGLSRLIDYQHLQKAIKQAPLSTSNKQHNSHNSNNQPECSSSPSSLPRPSISRQQLVLACFLLRACVKIAQLTDNDILSLQAAERVRRHIIALVKKCKAANACTCPFFNELHFFLHNHVAPNHQPFYRMFALWFEQERNTISRFPGVTASASKPYTSCHHCRESDSDQMSDIAAAATAAAATAAAAAAAVANSAADSHTPSDSTDQTMSIQPESDACEI